MGEIADEVFGGLRAGGPERLTVAGRLGIPQVICPGGAEHLGLFVEPGSVPEAYRDHQHVFHALKAGLPASVEVVEIDAGAEDTAFVGEAVRRLVGMLEHNG